MRQRIYTYKDRDALVDCCNDGGPHHYTYDITDDDRGLYWDRDNDDPYYDQANTMTRVHTKLKEDYEKYRDKVDRNLLIAYRYDQHLDLLELGWHETVAIRQTALIREDHELAASWGT